MTTNMISLTNFSKISVNFSFKLHIGNSPIQILVENVWKFLGNVQSFCNPSTERGSFSGASVVLKDAAWSVSRLVTLEMKSRVLKSNHWTFVNQRDGWPGYVHGAKARQKHVL